MYCVHPKLRSGNTLQFQTDTKSNTCYFNQITSIYQCLGADRTTSMLCLLVSSITSSKKQNFCRATISVGERKEKSSRTGKSTNDFHPYNIQKKSLPGQAQARSVTQRAFPTYRLFELNNWKSLQNTRQTTAFSLPYQSKWVPLYLLNPQQAHGKSLKARKRG